MRLVASATTHVSHRYYCTKRREQPSAKRARAEPSTRKTLFDVC